MNHFLQLLGLFISFTLIPAQEIATLKYNGGGDWYSNPTGLPNLVKFCNENISTTLDENIKTVEPLSPNLFSFPLVYMTGHGNVQFTNEEAQNLKLYLESGGFLFIDDNYGMAPYIKKALKNIFPNEKLEEMGANHPLFSVFYTFENGIPKIHEHEGKRPQLFGIFINNRLAVILTYESDLGDGWEDAEVHNNPPEVRLKALQMGANIIKYVFE